MQEGADWGWLRATPFKTLNVGLLAIGLANWTVLLPWWIHHQQGRTPWHLRQVLRFYPHPFIRLQFYRYWMSSVLQLRRFFDMSEKRILSLCEVHQ